jgi:non-specific serine/threonine protein kinase
LSLHRGELEEAEQLGRRCIELKRDLGDLVGMASALESLAPIAMSRAASERAATLLDAADAMWRSIPMSFLEPLRADHDRAGADARAAMGSARFESAHRAGLGTTRDELVDYVLEVRPSGARVVVGPPQPSDGPLSRREMEVAELIADGATNEQAAARLFISERTVESHVASIFNKARRRYPPPGRAMVRQYPGDRAGLKSPGFHGRSGYFVGLIRHES